MKKVKGQDHHVEKGRGRCIRCKKPFQKQEKIESGEHFQEWMILSQLEPPPVQLLMLRAGSESLCIFEGDELSSRAL